MNSPPKLQLLNHEVSSAPVGNEATPTSTDWYKEALDHRRNPRRPE